MMTRNIYINPDETSLTRNIYINPDESPMTRNIYINPDESPMTRNIYINPDESPMTRKENARLRKERDRLRNLDENAGKKIVIHKGKLKVDNIVHDELNIENQLFDGKNF